LRRAAMERRRSIRYNLVILGLVKTAISLSDDTFRRVDHAAKRLGLSRSEFFARAAESWLTILEEDDTTEAINRALRGDQVDHEFTDAAASALATADNAG
jgi:metal-responsive CopG/Arc/MetJ family transcriptional regulator